MNKILFFGLGLVNKFLYQRGKYKKVLKGFEVLHSNKEKYSAYVNLHRVFSLIHTRNQIWESEYRFIEESGQLDLLGVDDKDYITLYTLLIANMHTETIFDIKKIDLSKISKRTKKYFPWLVEDMKVALRKISDNEQGVAEVKFIGS